MECCIDRHDVPLGGNNVDDKTASELLFEQLVRERAEALMAAGSPRSLVSITNWTGHVIVCGSMSTADLMDLVQGLKPAR